MIIEDALQKIPSEFQALFVSMYNEIQELNGQVYSLKRALYGSKSERHISLPPIEPKGTLFNEAEVEAHKPENSDNEKRPQNPEEKPESKNRRSPASGGRKPLPPELPRNLIVHDLPEDEKVCPADLSPLMKIGEVVVEKIELIPSKIVVNQHVYPKYACTTCAEGIKQASAVPSILPGTQAEASLLAEVVFAKYLLAIPLYRQEAVFQQKGIDLSRTTLARWMISLAEALSPLGRLIKKHILSLNVIHGDETTIQVLKGTSKEPTSKSYMWVISSSTFDRPAIWFEFHPSRSQAAANELLKGFKGLLHVDAYGGYNAVTAKPEVTRVGCWAHSRRAFEDALKAGAKTGSTLAETFIEAIKELFMLEREFTELEPEERLTQRQDKSKAIVNNIRELIDKNITKIPPKAKLANAIAYLASDWPSFTVFLKDARAELCNNMIENHIRPFALGRKNWLFADTVAGAEASAMLYSIISTARANRLDVRAYLQAIFTELPLIDKNQDSNLEPLLPWNWKTSNSEILS